ncbi:MAG: ATP-binding cassette domain-containing protein [Deltaproteobacteria bacterium]|nr:ATP-binding cassette domain-containing protein [Deltaproteobacteria bacterium]
MITLKAITKYFNRGSINEVLSLDNINLDVEPGDFVAIIGSNGAGKSTLLNCVAGSHLLDSGKILLNHTEITVWPEHKRAKFMGRVFQDPLLGTCSTLSIEQNLALAKKRGQPRGLGIGVKNRDRDLFREKLKVLGLGLENRLQDKVGLLSGGQRQALTMIMATMIHPEVLLLDEHTAALDPKTAHQIIDLTNKIIHELKLTTLMVTHNMKQALEFGNRLIMLNMGRIIMDVRGQEKKNLTVQDLLAGFYKVQGEAFSSDKMLLVNP